MSRTSSFVCYGIFGMFQLSKTTLKHLMSERSQRVSNQHYPPYMKGPFGVFQNLVHEPTCFCPAF